VGAYREGDEAAVAALTLVWGTAVQRPTWTGGHQRGTRGGCAPSWSGGGVEGGSGDNWAQSPLRWCNRRE
jgi:hypothetical protein